MTPFAELLPFKARVAGFEAEGTEQDRAATAVARRVAELRDAGLMRPIPCAEGRDVQVVDDWEAVRQGAGRRSRAMKRLSHILADAIGLGWSHRHTGRGARRKAWESACHAMDEGTIVPNRMSASELQMVTGERLALALDRWQPWLMERFGDGWFPMTRPAGRAPTVTVDVPSASGLLTFLTGSPYALRMGILEMPTHIPRPDAQTEVGAALETLWLGRRGIAHVPQRGNGERRPRHAILTHRDGLRIAVGKVARHWRLATADADAWTLAGIVEPAHDHDDGRMTVADAGTLSDHMHANDRCGEFGDLEDAYGTPRTPGEGAEVEVAKGTWRATSGHGVVAAVAGGLGLPRGFKLVTLLVHEAASSDPAPTFDAQWESLKGGAPVADLPGLPPAPVDLRRREPRLTSVVRKEDVDAEVSTMQRRGYAVSVISNVAVAQGCMRVVFHDAMAA